MAEFLSAFDLEFAQVRAVSAATGQLVATDNLAGAVELLGALSDALTLLDTETSKATANTQEDEALTATDLLIYAILAVYTETKIVPRWVTHMRA
jgi:hypothetical protein